MTRLSLACSYCLVCLAACTSQGLSSHPLAPDAALGGSAGTGGTTTTGGSSSGGASALGSGGATGTGGLAATNADAAPTVDAKVDGAGGTTFPVITDGAGGVLSPDARVVGGSVIIPPPDALPPDLLPTSTDARTGILVATPASIAMGTVEVGSTASATLVITNVGATTTVKIDPSGAEFAASGCAGVLPSTASCILTIALTPVVAGVVDGSVDVWATPGTGIPLQITVTAVAVNPGSFFVTPSAISLGDVSAGAVVPIQVTVTAGTDLSGLVASVQGPDLKIDSTSTCTSTLRTGTSCMIAAVFISTAAGSPVSDAVVISQGGVVKSVPITANVLAPAKLAAVPASADLSAAPGTSSARLNINVGNVGGMSTGPLAVALGGPDAIDFAIVEDGCSTVTLAGGNFCVVTLAYKPSPTVSRTETATLTITDMGPAGSTASVRLSGGPTSPLGLTLAGGPALGSVAPGAVGAETLFTVRNNAATPTGALTASLTSSLITISSNTCAAKATLNQGESCTIGLQLAPPANTAPQTISALLTVTGTAGSTAASVTGNVVSR